MITPSLPSEANPTAVFMLIQNRAHHEDRLLKTKHTLDNKLKSFSRFLDPAVPSKKNYMNKEKAKRISQENINLLFKMQDIMFGKTKPAAPQYNSASKYSQDTTTIDLHPFSSDHRSKSLNAAARRKEMTEINKGNSHLLYKLRTMKPTVPEVGKLRQRNKNLDYLRNLIQKRDDTQHTRLLHSYMAQKQKGESVLQQYLVRHDILHSRTYTSQDHDSSLPRHGVELNTTEIDRRMMPRPNTLERESPSLTPIAGFSSTGHDRSLNKSLETLGRGRHGSKLKSTRSSLKKSVGPGLHFTTSTDDSLKNKPRKAPSIEALKKVIQSIEKSELRVSTEKIPEKIEPYYDSTKSSH